MSRSNYSDNLDQWAMIRWRGAVAAAIRGKRGQVFLRELLAALDTLPAKRLISHDLETLEGVCAIGAVGLRRRGIDMSALDPEDHDSVAAAFAIPQALAREIMFENDEGSGAVYWREEETPEQRWERMRKWVMDKVRCLKQA